MRDTVRLLTRGAALLLAFGGGCKVEEVCETLVDQAGSPSGFEVCWPDNGVRELGAVNRTDQVVCGEGRPLPECVPEPGVSPVCTSDDDCATGEQCAGGVPGCRCARTCGTDGHCPEGAICACPTANTGLGFANDSSECLVGSCRDHNDCGGAPCGVSLDSCGGWGGTFCREEARDRCVYDGDCAESEACRFTGERWSCEALSGCD